MKTKTPKLPLLIVLIASLLMTFAGCEETTEPDPDSNPDANEIAEGLKFRNGTVIQGTLATTIKTADLKIDVDTIFWVEDIKNRIRILKPDGVHIGHFHTQVEGTAFYIEAETEIEEETDTIAIINFDFDLTGLEPPFNFEVTIVLLDDGGTPIDEFVLPVYIEEAADNNCHPPTEVLWEWSYTTGSNDFYTASALPVTQSGTVVGCCSDTGDSYYDPSCANPNNNFRKVVNYVNSFTVDLEYLKFFKDGFLAGELFQYTRNLNVGKTNFCSGNAGYNERNVHNTVWGTFTFDQGDCVLTIDDIVGETDAGGFPLPFYAGAGPGVEYKLLSKHFLREKRNGGEESLQRFYTRREGIMEWHD